MQHNQYTKKLEAYQDSLYVLQDLVSLTRHQNLGSLLPGVLDELKEELIEDSYKALSDDAIGRVAGLSYSLLPENLLLNEKLSLNAISPERGQLLLSLMNMKIDSASLVKIKAQTSFAGSDLRNAPMNGLDLSGANLFKANVSGADMRKVNLAHANMEKALFKNANLNGASLKECNLVRAYLNWAELNEADLSNAILSGVDFSAASIRKTNLRGAKIDFSFLNGTSLNDSDLSNADLTGSDMTGANLSGAILSGANLKLVKFEGAKLAKADLDGAKVDGIDWISQLSKWNVKDAEEIGRIYQVRPDTASTSTFIIERI